MLSVMEESAVISEAFFVFRVLSSFDLFVTKSGPKHMTFEIRIKINFDSIPNLLNLVFCRLQMYSNQIYVYDT